MHAAPPPVRPRLTSAAVRRFLVALLVGEPPPGPPRASRRRPRAPRVRLSRMTADPGGIAWRTWWGRHGRVAAGDVDRVAFVTCEHQGDPGFQHHYWLVLDREGDVLLRVAGTVAPLRPPVLDTLDVPFDYESTAFGHAKGYRRRWPEAFGWAHAHPVLAGVGAFGVWVLVVETVERLLGA